MRGPRCHQNMPPRQRPFRQRRLHRSDDLQRFRHPARPIFSTGHLAFVRANHQHAICPQLRQIALGGRVIPHPHIHRRRHEHPRIGGQQQGRGQIISPPLRHLGHQIGGCGCHDDQIGNAAQLDMAHLGLGGQIEQIGMHLFARQRRDRQRRDEFLPCAGQHRRHRRATFAQAADQIQRLVGGNAAADDQKNALACQHDAPHPCPGAVPLGSSVMTIGPGRKEQAAARRDSRVPFGRPRKRHLALAPSQILKCTTPTGASARGIRPYADRGRNPLRRPCAPPGHIPPP